MIRIGNDRSICEHWKVQNDEHEYMNIEKKWVW